MNWEIIILMALALIDLVLLIWLATRRGAGSQVAKVNFEPLKLDVARQTQLEAALAQGFEEVIKKSTVKFDDDLSGVSAKLSQQLLKMTTAVIESQLESYLKVFVELKKDTVSTLEELEKQMQSKRQAAQAEVLAEVQTQKDLLLKRFEAKLTNIVAQYITEALGQSADLGSQKDYLFKVLEEGKADLIKELENAD